MFHLSPSIIRLISTLYKQFWPTSSSVLVIFVLITYQSYASQPDWVLSGTFLNSENAHAMFIDENGDELLLELGDDVQGCDLLDVMRGSAKLNCSGKEYTLHLRNSVGDILLQAEYEKSQAQSLAQLSAKKETVVLSKSEISDYVKEKQRLVSEIGFLPLIEDDQVVGFTLSKIKPGTKAAALGLYNGDVIKAVNGVPATDPEFLQSMEALAEILEVTVMIDRNGQPLAYTYIIE
jgi:type II secretion system protein C